MVDTDCMRIDGKNCSVYPLCSCMGINRTMYFDNMETDCRKYSGDNCRHYPICKCMGVDRSICYPFQDNPLCSDCPSIDECGSLGCEREKKDMTDRCNDCATIDTCNAVGCRGKLLEPCQDCSELFNCHRLGCLVEEGRCLLDEGCEVEGRVEDCSRCSPELDGRNESPVNQHGCSYIDCDCTVPCTSDPQKIVNITINGDNYGDIKL